MSAEHPILRPGVNISPQEPGIMRVTRPKELNLVEDALGTSLKCSIVMETM